MDAPEPAGTDARVDSQTRSFLIDVGGPSTGPVPPAFDMGDVDVAANATAILLEATWSCASPTCTLDLLLVGPEGDVVARSPGTGEASFIVSPIAPGGYRWGVETSSDPVVSAGGDVAATVFYDGPIPDGFTALDPSA